MLAINRLIIATSLEPKLGSYIEYQPADASVAHRVGGAPDLKGIYVGHWIAWDGKASKKGYGLSKIKTITKTLSKINETPHVPHINTQLASQGWVQQWVKERAAKAHFGPLFDELSIKFKALLESFGKVVVNSSSRLLIELKPENYKRALSILDGKFDVETDHMKGVANPYGDGLVDIDIAYISNVETKSGQCKALLKRIHTPDKRIEVTFELTGRTF